MQIAIFLLAFVIASCAAQNWNKLPGAAVEVSAKGNECWVINKHEQIYRWTGKHWEGMPGKAVRAGASPDGWTWVVNNKDEIFRWNLHKKIWERMPGALVQIDAISRDRALGVNRINQIFLWENNAWKLLPGAASWAAIGDGDERWVINSAQQIYRWNHQTNVWDGMPGAAVNIDVQNPCRVAVTNAAQQIFVWKNNGWKLLSGEGTRSTITETKIFTVNKHQEIYEGFY